jgi:ATP-dependent helicase HrpA
VYSGRTSDGIAIRLYAEDDYAKRPEYTDPEILRTDLAAVILQMMALGLGDILAFPFLQPPDKRGVRDTVSTCSPNSVRPTAGGCRRRGGC